MFLQEERKFHRRGLIYFFMSLREFGKKRTFREMRKREILAKKVLGEKKN